MADIEREERRIDEALASRREKEIYDFSRNYSGDFLASHEDGDVRSVATELINDRHVLSAMFSSPGAQEDSPKELAHKINRAVAEWRIELLNLRLRELSTRMAQCQNADAETTGNLQLQIVALMRRRNSKGMRRKNNILPLTPLRISVRRYGVLCLYMTTISKCTILIYTICRLVFQAITVSYKGED